MRIVFFVIYLSISIGGFAQNDTSSIVPDSLTLGTAPHLPKKVAFFDKLPHGKLFNSTYIGAPLVIGGLIVKHQDKKFRKLRNDFMPQFHRTFDKLYAVRARHCHGRDESSRNRKPFFLGEDAAWRCLLRVDDGWYRARVKAHDKRIASGWLE